MMKVLKVNYETMFEDLERLILEIARKKNIKIDILEIDFDIDNIKNIYINFYINDEFNHLFLKKFIKNLVLMKIKCILSWEIFNQQEVLQMNSIMN